MSDVILTNRLTGNTFLNSAVIRVITFKNSTVTITKNNDDKTIDQGHLLESDQIHSTYYFIIKSENYGIYTITSEQPNGQTITKTLSIASNMEYVVNLIEIDIYKNGIVTSYYPFYTYSNNTITIGASNITLPCGPGGNSYWAYVYFGPVTPIGLTLSTNVKNNSTGNAYFRIAMATAKDVKSGQFLNEFYKEMTTNETGTFSLKIDPLTNNSESVYLYIGWEQGANWSMSRPDNKIYWIKYE